MTVSITDNMTPVDDAESASGWSTTGTLLAVTGFQRENTNCIGDQASEGTDHCWFGIGAVDLSDVTIFVWLRNGNPHTEANGGFQIVVGDVTPDTVGYHVGGSDNYGSFFNGWSLFKLDTTVLPATYDEVEGLETNLDWTNITGIGGGWYFNSKATGNVDNVFIDVLRYVANGTAALSIGGGTTGARGTFAECVAEDEDQANAWGVFFNTVPGGSKAYEINFGVEFGDAGATDSFFEDADFQLFLTGTNMKAGNMDVTLLANAGQTNLFILDNFVITSIGIVSNWDLENADVDTLEITNGQFVDMGTITFPHDGGTSRFCNTTKFVNCGQVQPHDMEFVGNTFVGSTSVDGAVAIHHAGLSGTSFTSDGSGHAVEVTGVEGSPFAFVGVTFSGYGADGTTDAEVYNNTGGPITITIGATDVAPTVRNSPGSSTSIVASVDVDVHVQDVAAGDIEGVQVYIQRAVAASLTPTSGNSAGAASITVNEDFDGDQPGAGYLSILDRSLNKTLGYRYASLIESPPEFTLRAEVTGAATSDGSATSLISTSTNFLTADIEEGDTIRNTSTGEWAVVDEIVDADNIITSRLSAGIWNDVDNFSVHRLATALEDGVDVIDAPLFNGQTDVNGDIATLAYDKTQAPTAVKVRVRSQAGATKYIPLVTSSTISATSGLTLNVVLAEDTVAL